MSPSTILWIGHVRTKDTGLTQALGKRYTIVTAASGKQALQLAEQHSPRLIVLDAASMRTPGERLCRTLHAALPGVPIVHIHPEADGEIDTPADILLLPPFTHRKILSSIERLLDAGDVELLRCGPFQMDVSRRVLIAHGQETTLTPKLALLAEIFLRHPGQTFDRRTLMEQVWQTDYLGDTRTLDVHIRWMREVLEMNEGKPQYLKTVRGVGYRLDVPEAALSVLL